MGLEYNDSDGITERDISLEEDRQLEEYEDKRAMDKCEKNDNATKEELKEVIEKLRKTDNDRQILWDSQKEERDKEEDRQEKEREIAQKEHREKLKNRDFGTFDKWLRNEEKEEEYIKYYNQIKDITLRECIDRLDRDWLEKTEELAIISHIVKISNNDSEEELHNKMYMEIAEKYD